MGRVRRSRTHSNPKKNQAPGQKTRRYKRDIDQIHEDLKDNGKLKMIDTLRNNDIEDLPGMAEHHCLACSRYFADAAALTTHQASKPHKRRLKKLEEDPYTYAESLAAVNKGVDNGESARRKLQREQGMTVDSTMTTQA